MTKFWYPERNELDAIPALLKNFIHYHKFPVSKITIEKDVKESPDFPMEISLATIMKLLQKWDIEHKAFKCPFENVTDVAPFTILFVNDITGKKGGDFIMFYGLRGNEIEYLDTRKGWVVEDLQEFGKKFANVALTAYSIKESEKDFEIKEKQYEDQRLANPDLKIVRIVDDFLTDAECDYIIKVSTPLFQRSMFLYGDKKVLDERRTSYSAELHVFPDDKILNGIRKKASELINVPENHFEFIQCLSYDKKQEIDHHYDTFDPKSEGGKKIIDEGGQRKYTMLAYLNDDFEGGGTYFPELDYMVNPKKRRVVIFNNLDENGNVLKSSWHGGLPVTTGRKFAINIWVRNKPCR
jgi:prolyl 4-hydroxylase